MNTQLTLDMIEYGDMDATELLDQLDPKLAARYMKIMKSLSVLIDDVRERYTDASVHYHEDRLYLLLGKSHTQGDNPYIIESTANYKLTAIHSGDHLVDKVSGGSW